jgi:membrane-bound metal-dependent hydrolase YbcI (DUF457 family)
MFIGHFGVALAGRSLRPRPSLGTWLLASLALDLLWGIFLLAGWERVRIEPGHTAVSPIDLEHYPWSHSLLMSVVWALAFAGLYWARRRDGHGALLLGAGVLSHWVLDWLSHAPDLQLAPGVPVRVGLGLWNSVAGTLLVEGGVFAAGVWLYLRSTRRRAGARDWRFTVYIAFLATMYVASVFGPPPPSVEAIAWSAPMPWLLVLWAYWIDRRREGPAPTAPAPAGA